MSLPNVILKEIYLYMGIDEILLIMSDKKKSQESLATQDKILSSDNFWIQKVKIDFGKDFESYRIGQPEYSGATRYIQYLLDNFGITFFCENLIPLKVCFKRAIFLENGQVAAYYFQKLTEEQFNEFIEEDGNKLFKRSLRDLYEIIDEKNQIKPALAIFFDDIKELRKIYNPEWDQYFSLNRDKFILETLSFGSPALVDFLVEVEDQYFSTVVEIMTEREIETSKDFPIVLEGAGRGALKELFQKTLDNYDKIKIIPDVEVFESIILNLGKKKLLDNRWSGWLDQVLLLFEEITRGSSFFRNYISVATRVRDKKVLSKPNLDPGLQGLIANQDIYSLTNLLESGEISYKSLKDYKVKLIQYDSDINIIRQVFSIKDGRFTQRVLDRLLNVLLPKPLNIIKTVVNLIGEARVAKSFLGLNSKKLGYLEDINKLIYFKNLIFFYIQEIREVKNLFLPVVRGRNRIFRGMLNGAFDLLPRRVKKINHTAVEFLLNNKLVTWEQVKQESLYSGSLKWLTLSWEKVDSKTNYLNQYGAIKSYDTLKFLLEKGIDPKKLNLEQGALFDRFVRTDLKKLKDLY